MQIIYLQMFLNLSNPLISYTYGIQFKFHHWQRVEVSPLEDSLSWRVCVSEWVKIVVRNIRWSSPFPCCRVKHEFLGKKTEIEKEIKALCNFL